MVIRGVMLKYKPVLSLPKGSMVGKAFTHYTSTELSATPCLYRPSVIM